METVVLVIHLMLVAAMIAIILMQRSEGGALGIGGGGGGNFMAARGTGNILTRVTTILAAGFFVTSIVLTFIARNEAADTGIFDNLPANQINEGEGGNRPGDGGVLNLLGGGADDTPAIPDDAGDGAAAPGDAGDQVVVPDDAGGGAPEGNVGDGAAAPVLVPDN